MEQDPYTPPVAKTSSKLLRDLPHNERKKLILEGKTSAGILVVFIYKHPTSAALIGMLLIGALTIACWNLISM